MVPSGLATGRAPGGQAHQCGPPGAAAAGKGSRAGESGAPAVRRGVLLPLAAYASPTRRMLRGALDDLLPPLLTVRDGVRNRSNGQAFDFPWPGGSAVLPLAVPEGEVWRWRFPARAGMARGTLLAPALALALRDSPQPLPGFRLDLREVPLRRPILCRCWSWPPSRGRPGQDAAARSLDRGTGVIRRRGKGPFPGATNCRPGHRCRWRCWAGAMPLGPYRESLPGTTSPPRWNAGGPPGRRPLRLLQTWPTAGWECSGWIERGSLHGSPRRTECEDWWTGRRSIDNSGPRDTTARIETGAPPRRKRVRMRWGRTNGDPAGGCGAGPGTGGWRRVLEEGSARGRMTWQCPGGRHDLHDRGGNRPGLRKRSAGTSSPPPDPGSRSPRTGGSLHPLQCPWTAASRGRSGLAFSQRDLGRGPLRTGSCQVPDHGSGTPPASLSSGRARSTFDRTAKTQENRNSPAAPGPPGARTGRSVRPRPAGTPAAGTGRSGTNGLRSSGRDPRWTATSDTGPPSASQKRHVPQAHPLPTSRSSDQRSMRSPLTKSGPPPPGAVEAPLDEGQQHVVGRHEGSWIAPVCPRGPHGPTLCRIGTVEAPPRVDQQPNSAAVRPSEPPRAASLQQGQGSTSDPGRLNSASYSRSASTPPPGHGPEVGLPRHLAHHWSSRPPWPVPSPGGRFRLRRSCPTDVADRASPTVTPAPSGAPPPGKSPGGRFRQQPLNVPPVGQQVRLDAIREGTDHTSAVPTAHAAPRIGPARIIHDHPDHLVHLRPFRVPGSVSTPGIDAIIRCPAGSRSHAAGAANAPSPSVT
jgi:hypothetical protein